MNCPNNCILKNKNWSFKCVKSNYNDKLGKKMIHCKPKENTKMV